ncbi:MAG TPA: SDR family oxidoreductase [Pseudolysinimonas sp.]|nr:SDR family oxidoreductase [Pseudolysinimonas sp.]
MTTRIAWVAGSTGGIGSECGRRLAEDGWQVIGSDRPEVDIATAGSAEAWLPGALGDAALDGAVHAVGMSGRRLGDGPLTACTDEAWDEVLRVDLTSVFRFLRLALRAAADGASIVVIGSALATTLDRDFLTTAYRTAKAAIVPLVEAAAYEGAARGIRVNVVSAGLVDTPMATRALGDPQIAARLPELMPLGARAVSPAEIAQAVAWLLGPDSARTTGAVIPVDGGWSLR